MIEWGSVAQWASATATTAAEFVALFKDQNLSCFRRPKLTVRALPSPPDSGKIPFVYTMPISQYGEQPIHGSVALNGFRMVAGRPPRADL